MWLAVAEKSAESNDIAFFLLHIFAKRQTAKKKCISHNMYQTFVWRGYAKFLWLHLILTWHTFISRKGNKAICSPTHMLILSWLDTRTNDIPLLSTNNAQWLGLVDKGYSNCFSNENFQVLSESRFHVMKLIEAICSHTLAYFIMPWNEN